MSLDNWLDSLNDAQKEAVTAEPGHLLVLAGAGSGKTRVLVSRIAWLHFYQHVPLANILAVTFTNKAANEMKQRLQDMLGVSVASLWIGTFHGIAHRLCRQYADRLGLSATFQIIDSDDQLSIIKRMLRESQLDEEQYAPKKVQAFINHKKDAGLRAKQITQDAAPTVLRELYARYEQHCEQQSLVDFAELLLRSYELWQQHPDVLAHYRKTFQHILVDEFQDTSELQNRWLKKLIDDQNYLMVVGDDDQSIYGWRGAEVAHIRNIEHELPGCRVIRLEQNYRSSGHILTVANHVISRNRDRLGKELWTDHGDGDPIQVYGAFNDLEEARFIVDFIRGWVLKHRAAYRDCAILYRSNAQSRVLEEALLHANIPYRIFGGLRFFERAEIKDAMSYLRLVVNPHDDAAFERVINTPARGIGAQTVNQLRHLARETQQSLFDATEQAIEQSLYSNRTVQALSNFLIIIKTLQGLRDEPLAELAQAVLLRSGLSALYEASTQEKDRNRFENLQEWVEAANECVLRHLPDNLETPLVSFLAQAVLDTGDENLSDAEIDGVQLMTLHTAKGLEFPLVCLTGLEEGLFPHQLSLQDPEKLSEERRLCYVGMTRAMRTLLLTYAEKRRLHGNAMQCIPSRFIRDLPEHILHEHHVSLQTHVPSYQRSPAFSSKPRSQEKPLDSSLPYQLGQTVKHRDFGEGVVLRVEGQSTHLRVQIRFAKHGIKWLLAQSAPLSVV